MTSDRIICLLAVAASMTCGAAESFRIAKDAMPEIVIQEGVRPFVAKAAEDVAGDLEKIFGVRAKVSVGKCSRVEHVERVEESTGRSGPAIVLAKGGEGWENYAIESAAGNVLKITGSDDRGVMFGLYRFASECLGVDPFYFWSGREPSDTQRPRSRSASSATRLTGGTTAASGNTGTTATSSIRAAP